MSSKTQNQTDSGAYNETDNLLYKQLKTATELYRDKNGGQKSIVANDGYTMPEPACAYIIECGNVKSVDIVDKRTKEIVGYTRNDMQKAYHSRKRFQIGSSQQIHERIGQHINDNGSLLTSVFAPVELRDIWFLSSYSEARQFEESLAVEYERRFPFSFIWQK